MQHTLLTKEQETVIKTAFNWIRANVCEEQFDMKYYRAKNGFNALFRSESDCGTTGCLLGWFPFVIPTKPSDFTIYIVGSSKFLDYRLYVNRILDIDTFCHLWQWLFHENWASVDNSLYHAFGRMNYAIKYGAPRLNIHDMTKDKSVNLRLKEILDKGLV